MGQLEFLFRFWEPATNLGSQCGIPGGLWNQPRTEPGQNSRSLGILRPASMPDRPQHWLGFSPRVTHDSPRQSSSARFTSSSRLSLEPPQAVTASSNAEARRSLSRARPTLRAPRVAGLSVRRATLRRSPSKLAEAPRGFVLPVTVLTVMRALSTFSSALTQTTSIVTALQGESELGVSLREAHSGPSTH